MNVNDVFNGIAGAVQLLPAIFGLVLQIEGAFKGKKKAGKKKSKAVKKILSEAGVMVPECEIQTIIDASVSVLNSIVPDPEPEPAAISQGDQPGGGEPEAVLLGFPEARSKAEEITRP